MYYRNLFPMRKFFLYFFSKDTWTNNYEFVFCYSDGDRSGGGDFVAGFLLGGAVFGTLAYIFAPQVIECFVLKFNMAYFK